jgi:arylsulfatase A-like enzyme
VTALIGNNGARLGAGERELLYDHFVAVDGSPYIQLREGRMVHATDYIAAKAVEFIAGQSTSRPWLLEVSFFAPHADDGDPQQYVPPTRYADLYQGIDHPDPPLSDPAFFAGLPAFLQDNLNRERWYWRWTPDLADGMLSSYLAMIHGVDDAVGEILDAIGRFGFRDDTVVVLYSDHGCFVGERGYAGKWLAYEPSIRLPLIVTDPRGIAGAAGSVIDEIVLNIDLPETILELAGVDIPAAMQGRSLVPLLQGAVPDWRVDTFLEHSWTSPPVYVIPRHESLRTERFTYIHYIDHGREELYDLVLDPDQGVNLAGEPGWDDELESLRRRTIELRDLYAGLIFADGFEGGDTGAWTGER